MKRLKFLKEPITYVDETEFIAYLAKASGKEDLLNKLSVALNFPDYFGFNWDALYDYLRDFHWIDKKGIVLVHSEFPILSDEILKIYLEVLVDTIQDWKEGEEHYFKVVFPEQSKQLIEEILQ